MTLAAIARYTSSITMISMSFLFNIVYLRRPYSGAYSLLANSTVYIQLESRCYSGAFAVYSDIYYTMRVCVTCASNSPEIDLIYQYCQRNDLLMHTGAYIYADESYWIWRIETEACPALTWLLLRYPDQLTVF